MSKIAFQEAMSVIELNIKKALLKIPNRRYPLLLLGIHDYVATNDDNNYHYRFRQCLYRLFKNNVEKYNFILLDSLTKVSVINASALLLVNGVTLASDILIPPSIIQRTSFNQEIRNSHCIQMLPLLQTTSINGILQIDKWPDYIHSI
jgi:hypothetical protein